MGSGAHTVWSGRCALLCLTSSVSSFPGCSMHALRFCRRGTSAAAITFDSVHGTKGLRSS